MRSLNTGYSFPFVARPPRVRVLRLMHPYHDFHYHATGLNTRCARRPVRITVPFVDYCVFFMQPPTFAGTLVGYVVPLLRRLPPVRRSGFCWLV